MASQMVEIRWHARGGQGAKTAAIFVGEAVLDRGKFGQGFPEMLVGSPDTISAKIEAAARAVPIDECFFLIPQGIHDRDQILKSLDLVANKVIPRFADMAPDALSAVAG